MDQRENKSKLEIGWPRNKIGGQSNKIGGQANWWIDQLEQSHGDHWLQEVGE